MAQTKKEFAYFNVPLDPNTYISPEDAWLFTEPIHTFAIGTPEESVLASYKIVRARENRVVGPSRIPSRVILKVRHVHYTDYVKVTGVDAVKEPIDA